MVSWETTMLVSLHIFVIGGLIAAYMTICWLRKEISWLKRNIYTMGIRLAAKQPAASSKLEKVE